LVFDSNSIVDYRFYCYGGSVKLIEVCSAGQREVAFQDFDAEWNFLWHWEGQGESSPEIYARPGNLDAMIEASEAIGQFFSLVRVDLYTNDVDFLVGEITHCDGGACNPPESRSKETKAAELLFS